MKQVLGLVGLVAGLALGSAAGAAPIEGGITAGEVANVLQEKGYKADVGRDDDGDPRVKSAADGVNFTVFFYGCNHTTHCTSVTFQSGFHLDGGVSLDKVDSWNHDKRFLKAWRDKENDPYVEMDVDTEHGFTTESLGNYIDAWTARIPEFKTFIGF
ncbi:MAG TPA: YbjN domain-containing protein [Caulobacteraceae bacterium]